MRTLLISGAVVLCLVLGGAVLWAASELGTSRTETRPPATAVQGWVVMSTTTDRVQQIVVADPASQALAVYHVDLTSGRITLKSVRNVRFDLLMTEFNTDTPSPRDLESIWKTP